jgi:hypothetical protein
LRPLTIASEIVTENISPEHAVDDAIAPASSRS